MSADLQLPPPRIWKKEDVANFFGFSIHWVYDRTNRSAADPIPKIPGAGQLRFDTQSPDFQAWVRRQLGEVDNGDGQ